MIQIRRFAHLFVQAIKAWSDDYAASMGAAISYYTVFSLAPLLVIVIAIAGAVFGREAVEGQIVAQLSGLIGQEGATFVQNLVAASRDTDKGLVAGLISGAVLLVGSTTVFAELQSALDRIWHVPDSQKPQGIWATLRARLLSFGLILGLVFLLATSLVFSAAVAAIGALTSELMPGAEALLQLLNIAVSLGLFTTLFAMIFKFMPTTEIEWKDVWVGAFVTAVLFEVGKFLIGLYIGKSSMTESFAAAGSLVVLILWVYYAAQIFLLGAEFTKVYAQEHGSRCPAATADAAAGKAGQTAGKREAHPGAAPGPAPEPRRAPSRDTPITAALAVSRGDLERAEKAAQRPDAGMPLPPVPAALQRRVDLGANGLLAAATTTLLLLGLKGLGKATGKGTAKVPRKATAS